jgi:hypothetical protein
MSTPKIFKVFRHYFSTFKAHFNLIMLEIEKKIEKKSFCKTVQNGKITLDFKSNVKN